MKEEEIYAVTQKIEVQDLIWAYNNYIFPWPIDESFIPWVSPEQRGLLFIKGFHVPRSLLKRIKKKDFTVTYCLAFDEVVENCALVKRKGQSGTWITEPVKKAYKTLFKLKRAYSVEVWQKQKLVGGVYGVISSKYISGESMFHLETNASKIALYFLVQRLVKLKVPFLDIQMVTPLLKSLGAKEISRKEFQEIADKGIIEEGFYKNFTKV